MRTIEHFSRGHKRSGCSETHTPKRIPNYKQKICRVSESNQGHRDFQSLALPTELLRQTFLIFNISLLYSLNIFNQEFYFINYCGANQAVTFLPSTIGFFSTLIGSLAKSAINRSANSTAKCECCISRPLNITTIFTLLP